VEGKLQFANVDLRKLLRESADAAYLGGGKITGRLDFTGPGLGSLEDLTATLEARLAQTQALEFPVLRQLSPILGVSRSTSFQKGDLRARLARGVARVERLSLEGGPADLFLTGTVTPQGRINLDVHARTRATGLSLAALRVAGIQLPLQGTMPGRLLTQANTFLSSRLIHLRVTGTVSAPTVQVMVLELLRDEAVRFFLGRLGVPGL
jgi:hypothetical protein